MKGNSVGKKYKKINKSRRASKRSKKVRTSKKSIYPSEEELINKVEKYKSYKKTDRKRTNMVNILIFILLLLVLMYIGISIKGQFIMSQCVDTDYGKNVFIPGTIRFIENGNVSTQTDECIDENNLKEFYCQNGKPVEEIVRCENGCSNGRCMPAGTCMDSDEGINPEGKGICIDQNGGHIDKCYSNRELIEYYCSKGMCLSTRIVCNGVCYSGRCVPDEKTGKIMECEEQLGECMAPSECRNVKGSIIGKCSDGYVCCLK